MLKIGSNGRASISTESCYSIRRVSSVSGGPTYSIGEALNALGYGTFHFQLTLLTGFTWMTDAFEKVILSLIGQVVSCDWSILRWQMSLLTTVEFAGMAVGCPMFGYFSDCFGRRSALGSCVLFVFVFGVMSAASPSFYWLISFKALLGFSLGGLLQIFTLCSEYFPFQKRGKASFFLSYFWATGTIVMTLAMWGVMTVTRSWRSVLAVATIPALISIMALKGFPESVRYYMVHNQREDAMNALKEMEYLTIKELPPGQLLPASDCKPIGYFKGLLSPKFKRSTLLLWLIGVMTSFCYHGLFFASPLIMEAGEINNSTETQIITLEPLAYYRNPVPCIELNREDYIRHTWRNAAELPGLLVFTILVDVIDRKKLLCLSCSLSGILIFALVSRSSMNYLMIGILFAARALLVAQYIFIMIMTAEIFPTTLRGFAIGTGGGWSKFGGLISPYLTQVLLSVDTSGAICALGSAMFIAVIAAIYLPIETREMELLEVHEGEEGNL